MSKLLCFISLVMVSVFASIPAGPCRIMNSNGNVLKLDIASGTTVVGGSNSVLVPMWQLQPVPKMASNVYTIIPIPDPTLKLVAPLMTFDTADRDTIVNGDNATLQSGAMENSKFQWMINPASNTSEYYTIMKDNFNLDLAAGSKQEGAKVQAYQSVPGNANQLWKFVESV